MTMLLNYLLCYILFIPVIKTTVTNNLSTEKTALTEKFNKAKVAVLSEGGPTILLKNTTNLAPPKDHHDTLLDLEELVTNKPDSSSSSKIKPRKGVENYGNNTDVQQEPNLRQDTTTNHSSNTVSPSINVTKTLDSSSTTPKTIVASQNQSSAAFIKGKESTTIKPVPRKPLVLSYDELDNVDLSPAAIVKMSTVLSSSKTVVANQMRSSIEEPLVSIKSAINRGHPEMVIPVVITMIVVPLFAVLGYMALKRGKEAWRNRHYKRMDFLLDGMYNE